MYIANYPLPPSQTHNFSSPLIFPLLVPNFLSSYRFSSSLSGSLLHTLSHSPSSNSIPPFTLLSSPNFLHLSDIKLIRSKISYVFKFFCYPPMITAIFFFILIIVTDCKHYIYQPLNNFHSPPLSPSCKTS